MVQAYLIYNAQSNSYVDDGTLVTINCERLQSFTPVKVWLQRWLAAGDGTLVETQITFDVNSVDLTQYGANLIQGVYIEQDGAGMIIDIASAATLLDACNACCDDSPVATLTRFYTGGIPSFSNPVSANFCITRLDDGSASAHNEAALAYAGSFQGSIKLVSSLSGTSRYQVVSYTGWPPAARGTDIVATGTC